MNSFLPGWVSSNGSDLALTGQFSLAEWVHTRCIRLQVMTAWAGASQWPNDDSPHVLGRWFNGGGNEWGSRLGWIEGEAGFQPNAGMEIGNSFDIPNPFITSKLI
jgi:hypothetical protein